MPGNNRNWNTSAQGMAENNTDCGGIGSQRDGRRGQSNRNGKSNQNRNSNKNKKSNSNRQSNRNRPTNQYEQMDQGGIISTPTEVKMGAVIQRSDAVKGVEKSERSKRLDAVILVDMSGSMIGDEYLLQKCVEMLYKEILNDDAASRAVEIGIVAYSSVIMILQEIVEIFNQPHRGKGFEFVCSDATLTGHAVREALKMLDERGAMLKGSGLRKYPPQLFILSDGDPYCSEREVQKKDQEYLEEMKTEIRKRVQENKLSVFSLMIGDDFRSDFMRELTGLDTMDRTYHIERNEEEFKRFFKWVSDFLKSKSSGGNPEEYSPAGTSDIRRGGVQPRPSRPAMKK